ncbi:MAG TPA: VOC family protein [Steroidobacteraceae bacterium]|jgi:catechol 2,3-dioxygenase-like lactoylglutathione lyase family enzyme
MMKRFNQLAAAWLSAVLLSTVFSLAHAQGKPDTPAWQGARLGFVGRVVRDLDRSVAFYKMIGFTQDPLAQPVWRTDPVVEGLYGVKGFTTRMAKMYVVNPDSGQHFVVYLREVKGIKRTDLSHHTAWEPGATHFGLVVADADQVWAKLQAAGLLHARSWGGKLIAPPGQSKGMLAYITDPDGLDIELINQRPATPAQNGRRAQPGLLPGVNHMGLVILDADKCKAFYSGTLGGVWPQTPSPWLKGDFYDSAVGGHGNVLRFFNVSFPQEIAPNLRMNLELVEYQNRKAPVRASRITDSGVGYIGMQVPNLDIALQQVLAAGAKQVSKPGIVTMRSGTREVMIRDPDTGVFLELFDEPPAK